MEWTEALNRTIAFAEAHLRERLTVADLANEAGISAFHLQRGFRIITGFSLGEYVRNRRLYCAALEIANTERSILDIALDFQYETAESFTKAFSRFHGSTPSQVRSAGAKKICTSNHSFSASDNFNPCYRRQQNGLRSDDRQRLYSHRF